MAKALAALGVLAVLTLGGLVALNLQGRGAAQRAEALAEKGAAQPLTPLYPAPAFAFTAHDGATTTLASLRGQVWVANFVFTQCRTICPLLTAKMVQLQRRLADTDARFVSFSVDPEHDTPDVLNTYAQRWAPNERRWQLLATTAQTLPELTRGFRVTATKNETPGAVDPIFHSSVFVLVDREGQVRGVYDSELRADFEALERGTRLLAGAPTEGAAPLPNDGAELYHALACANCHERPELAPALDGLAGERRELENGLVATYDEAYVRESVLAPDAKRVRGYPLRMPTYDGLLTAAQLEALGTWLLARPKKGHPEAAAHLAVDPICDMEVRVTADTPRAPAPDGGLVYFCSRHCQHDFEARSQR